MVAPANVTSTLASFDAQHDDMIHDAVADYYGRKLATASSDRTVRIHDIGENRPELIIALKGHSGPVWQVDWAHPKFGQVLASCSYDSKVLVWREINGVWQKWWEHTSHTASVNSVKWAPYEFGLMLACGSSDGRISIIQCQDNGHWITLADFLAHQIGCNALSWAPPVPPGNLVTIHNSQTPPTLLKSLCSAGCDNLIKIWSCNADGTWRTDPEVLEGHTDWVRDIAWAPNIGLPMSYIASCSQDKTAIVWTMDSSSLLSNSSEGSHNKSHWQRCHLLPSTASAGGIAADPSGKGNGPAAPNPTGGASAKDNVSAKFPEPLWRVNWSLFGNVLAVAGGNNKVTLWKENSSGSWECISEMDEGTGSESAGSKTTNRTGLAGHAAPANMTASSQPHSAVASQPLYTM